MKKLGFGMMRLPTVDPKATEQIDLPQVCGMVDTFLARGYTYFDTAYFYHASARSGTPWSSATAGRVSFWPTSCP